MAKKSSSAIYKTNLVKQTEKSSTEQFFKAQVHKLVKDCFANYYGPYLSWFDDLYTFFNDKSIQKKYQQLRGFQQLKSKILVDNYPVVNKAILIFQDFYADQELVKAYYYYHKDSDRDFLDLLIWEGCFPYKTAREHFGETILKVAPEQTNKLMCQPAYMQFASYVVSMERHDKLNTPLEKLIKAKSVHFWMPAFMRYSLATVAQKPNNYQLNPYHLSKGCSFYQVEELVFQTLPYVQQLISRQQLKCNKNGTLNLPSLKRLQGKSTISAFTGDPGHATLFMLASFLNYDDGLDNAANGFTPGSNEAVIAYITHIFLQQGRTTDMLSALLYPFEGFSKIRAQFLHPEAISDAFTMLCALPQKDWVSLDNLLDYGTYHHIGLQFMDEPLVSSLKLQSGTNYYDSYIQSNPLMKNNAIQRIFFTGVLLAASSFGLLELAYDKVLTARYKRQPDKMQDGLFSACRLTSLGRHILLGEANDTQNKYVPPIGACDKNGFVLSEESLSIGITGNQVFGQELLKPWTSMAKKSVRSQKENAGNKTARQVPHEPLTIKVKICWYLI